VYELVIRKPFWNFRSTLICIEWYVVLTGVVVVVLAVRPNCANSGRPALSAPSV
jgi:hypothetical protein